MSNEELDRLFGLTGKVAIVTGGTGVLGGVMAQGLARAGARVGIVGRRRERGEEVAVLLCREGGEAMSLPADVLQRGDLERVREEVLERWGSIDILVNAAGGNVPGAALEPGKSLLESSVDAFSPVFDLNILGTVLPTHVFGQAMVQKPQPKGVIVNISSATVPRAVTRAVGYSAAKAAVENFTRWLAVDLARRYGAEMRVNAIAPGFFIAEQNRRLLTNEDGSLTERGQAVIDLTPAARFGEPEELVGTLLWLCGAGSSFVNGVIVPVDGGFGAFSGV